MFQSIIDNIYRTDCEGGITYLKQQKTGRTRVLIGVSVRSGRLRESAKKEIFLKS